MSQRVTLDLDLPDDLSDFRLPAAVQRRLQFLLDRQDQGRQLTESERDEAAGLVEVAEVLTLLKLRAERSAGASIPE